MRAQSQQPDSDPDSDSRPRFAEPTKFGSIFGLGWTQTQRALVRLREMDCEMVGFARDGWPWRIGRWDGGLRAKAEVNLLEFKAVFKGC